MLKIFLTVDLQTHRGLYDNEATFLGIFLSIREAEEKLGDILNYCSIRAVV
jgi:hypothetical protein